MRNLAVHDRFLRRVRWRWMVWRVMESAGLCAFGGVVVGLPLVGVLMWRGQGALGPALMLTAIGAAAGVMLGLTRRPSLLRTAMEVDRQLGLHDLLSTVIRKQRCGDEAFERVVVAQAEGICSSLSGSELILHRLGGRAWGGMGIATGLMITLALMSGGPTALQARTEDPMPVGRVGQDLSRDSESPAAGVSSLRPDGASDVRDVMREEDPPVDRTSSHEARASSARPETASRDGAGLAAGQSHDQVDARMRPVTAEAAREPGEARGSTEAMVKSQPMTRGAPPWQSESWRNDRAAAARDINSGRVPDTYRDLVREYFNREQ